MSTKFRLPDTRQATDQQRNPMENREQVYNIVDTFLQGLRVKEGGYMNVPHGPFKGTAFNIMHRHDLISYANPLDKTASLINITLTGLDVLEKGGIKNYLRGIQDKEEKQDQINTLTLQKLRLEQIPDKWWWAIALSQIIIAAAITWIVDVLRAASN